MLLYFLCLDGSNRKAFVVSPRHLNANHTLSPLPPVNGHHHSCKNIVHLKSSCNQLETASGGQDCVKNFDVADIKFDLSNRKKVTKFLMYLNIYNFGY